MTHSSDHFTVLKLSPQLKDLNPVMYLWDVMEQKIGAVLKINRGANKLHLIKS